MLRAVEPGFSDAQIAEATRLTRIVLPAQVFFILGQLFTAWQFARERFVIATLGPIIYNLGIIAGGLIGGARAGRAARPPTGSPGACSAGSFVRDLRAAVVGRPACGLRLPGEPIRRRHPAVRRYFALAIP